MKTFGKSRLSKAQIVFAIIFGTVSGVYIWQPALKEVTQELEKNDANKRNEYFIVSSSTEKGKTFKIPHTKVEIPVKKVPLMIAGTLTFYVFWRYAIAPRYKEMRRRRNEAFATALYEQELMTDVRNRERTDPGFY